MGDRDWIAYAGEVEEERNRLRNDLAEARAQIKHIDYAYGKMQARHDRLVAQIAAKDAALTLYREAVEVDVKMNGSFFMGVKRDALRRAWEADRAAPAGETE